MPLHTYSNGESFSDRPYQALVKMWRSWNFCTLLVEMQMVHTLLWKKVGNFLKSETRTHHITQPFHSEVFTQEKKWKHMFTQKPVYECSEHLHQSQTKTGNSPMSITSWMEKQMVVHSYNQGSLHNEQEWSTDTLNNMDESQSNCMKETRQNCVRTVWLVDIKSEEMYKYVVTESQPVVARNKMAGRGRREKWGTRKFRGWLTCLLSRLWW